MGKNKIYCCGCERDVNARLTNGKEIYAHRPDLYGLPFWKCDDCGNFVGCHHKTAKPTQPLGVIPTKAITALRKQIHAVLDPIWQGGGLKRAQVYARMSAAMGKQYHTADIRTIDEAKEVLKIAREIGI